jgi:hypothetical protein
MHTTYTLDTAPTLRVVGVKNTPTSALGAAAEEARRRRSEKKREASEKKKKVSACAAAVGTCYTVANGGRRM